LVSDEVSCLVVNVKLINKGPFWGKRSIEWWDLEYNWALPSTGKCNWLSSQF
jgi:hypothetical protein